MTSDDKIQKHFERKAEEHSLSVEWKGDDYGARKRYYADAYLAGCKRGLLIGTMLGIAERESIFNETMATARAELEKLIAAPEGEDK